MAKEELKSKFIAIDANLKRKKREIERKKRTGKFHVNNLTLQIKQLKKQEQNKPRISR